jgi:hypothetical protein
MADTVLDLRRGRRSDVAEHVGTSTNETTTETAPLTLTAYCLKAVKVYAW